MSQHKAPHRNWMPAERHYNALFDGIDLPEPETLFDDYSIAARRSRNRRCPSPTISSGDGT
jgi:hypothetical protein